MTSTPDARTLADSTVYEDHHHHFLHTRRRLRHFLRPDGRKVHIAGSPEEVEKLRRTLSIIEKDQFDLVIHGSPEHVEALRHTHAHHKEKHRKLRDEHGDLLDDFERVIRELDSLSAELHYISEHAVQLDANFSKYGYAAHLRTKDDSPNASSANSMHEDSSSDFSKDKWEDSRHQGAVMKFYETPIVRQYFHKGLLWRSKESQEVAPYELFIDLFYVGIIAISGDNAAEHATGESLLHFAITFILGWKFWSDISVLISWFDSDDILRRITILFILTSLLGFTTNMAAAWEHTYTSMISFYLAARLFIGVSYVWNAWSIPMIRGSMIGNAVGVFVPSVLWIGSIHVKEPERQAFIWIALALDIFSNAILVIIQRGGSWMSESFSAWSRRTFEFYPGTNIEHRIERTNAFVTMVFGYSVIGCLFESSAGFGINDFFGKAVLGLIQAFAFNWLYFELDSFNLHAHAIRRHVSSALVWFSIHVPFIMAYVLSASSLTKLVLAHDSAHADLEHLLESYATRSEEALQTGQRWFYCAGLGTALACMGIISLTHEYKTIPNQRLHKPKRLLIRFAVSLVIILLPLAGDRLSSLELVAITTCLVVGVLALELLGSTCIGEDFWWDDKLSKKCKYSAKCKVTRRELEESVREGKVIKVEDVARREKGFKGGCPFTAV